jgi:hypothetical protein
MFESDADVHEAGNAALVKAAMNTNVFFGMGLDY